MAEKWKLAKMNNPNLKGLFEVSNYGGFRSIKRKSLRISHQGNPYETTMGGNYLYQGYTEKSRNLKVTCSRTIFTDGKKNVHTETVYVHRAVAEMFIPNPDPDKYDKVVHIKPEDHHNNHHTNLKWSNQSEISLRTMKDHPHLRDKLKNINEASGYYELLKKENMKEQWLEIDLGLHYTGRFSISNYGRFRRNEFVSLQQNYGGKKFNKTYTEKILQWSAHPSHGSPSKSLTVFFYDKSGEKHAIHKTVYQFKQVAIAFLPNTNPEKYDKVVKIFRNIPARFDNLRWTNQSEIVKAAIAKNPQLSINIRQATEIAPEPVLEAVIDAPVVTQKRVLKLRDGRQFQYKFVQKNHKWFIVNNKTEVTALIKNKFLQDIRNKFDWKIESYTEFIFEFLTPKDISDINDMMPRITMSA